MSRLKGSKDKQPRKRRSFSVKGGLCGVKLSDLNKVFAQDAIIPVSGDLVRSLFLKNYTPINLEGQNLPTPEQNEPIQFTIIDPRQECEESFLELEN